MRGAGQVFDFPIYTFNDANLSAGGEVLSEQPGLLPVSHDRPFTGRWSNCQRRYLQRPVWLVREPATALWNGRTCVFLREAGLFGLCVGPVHTRGHGELRSTFAWPSGRTLCQLSLRTFLLLCGLDYLQLCEDLDPETVIIGEWWLKWPRKTLRGSEACVNEQFLLGDQPVSILPAQVKANSVIIGGAYFCFDNILL